MTIEETPGFTRHDLHVSELAERVWQRDPPIEVDKMLIIPASVGVVASKARYVPIDHVPLVRLEAVVIENAVPVVALIAQFIGSEAFRARVRCIVISQHSLVGGPVGSFGSGLVIVAMAV